MTTQVSKKRAAILYPDTIAKRSTPEEKLTYFLQQSEELINVLVSERDAHPPIAPIDHGSPTGCCHSDRVLDQSNAVPPSHPLALHRLDRQAAVVLEQSLPATLTHHQP